VFLSDRFQHAECVNRMFVAAPQDYVNTYSTSDRLRYERHVAAVLCRENARMFGSTLDARSRARTTHRSWLHDTLKRKLVDFAWIRRFFYLPGACPLFFG